MTIEAQKPPRTLSGFDLRGLGAIIAVGFILRLGWALSVHSGLIAGLDMQGYYNSAKNLADGYGLTVRRSFGVGELAGPGGVPSLAFPPGYSLTLAGVFRVFGDSLTAGKLLNVVAGTLTIPLVYCLALRWYGRTTALVAAALFAAYPANIFWTSVLYSDLVFTLPFALALVLLVEQDLSPKNARMVAFGIVLGYATIIRPQALVLLIAAALYFAIRAPARRQVIVPILAAIVGVAFCIAPIAAWNTHRAGRFVLLSESLGYNLRIGHSPNATGGFTYPQDLLSDTAAGTRPPRPRRCDARCATPSRIPSARPGYRRRRCTSCTSLTRASSRSRPLPVTRRSGVRRRSTRAWRTSRTSFRTSSSYSCWCPSR
jgi:hypothetical protein